MAAMATDIPKNEYFVSAESASDSETSSNPEDYTTKKRTGFLGTLRRWELLLDQKLGVEAQGPERILPHKKNPPPIWLAFAIWASGTMNLSCFATGFIGPLFLGLDLAQSIVIVIFGTLLGAMLTGWCATLGAPTGLRQVSICRYSFGWWPSKIIAALNVFANTGWAAVGSITGGLALTAVSDGNISLVPGVIIISALGLVFSFLGLRAVFKFEEYAWIVFFIIFMVIYGEAAPMAVETGNQLEGNDLAGAVLTLFAIVFGSSASWASISSDYYVHYPVDISKVKVFMYTTIGVTIPTCIGMLAGVCVGTTVTAEGATGFTGDMTWYNAYNPFDTIDNPNTGLGYLVQAVLYPYGFAKFVLVLLVLSGVGMSCISIYSVALSIQQFARPFQLIPRFIWTIVIFGVIVALGLAGRNSLLNWLSDLLPILGYWACSFFVIVFCEHYIFRGGKIENYDLEAWNTPSKLPIGLAGGLAFCFGVMGWVLGMSQSWYVGVIAAKIGTYGGDIGNELSFLFTLVTFIPFRYLELKYIGR